MTLYLFCKKEGLSLTLHGISTDEDKAKASIRDGKWIIIPIKTNTNYGQDIINESMPGVSTYTPITDGIEAQIAELSNLIGVMNTDLVGEINTLRQQATNQFNNLDARITALENL